MITRGITVAVMAIAVTQGCALITVTIYWRHIRSQFVDRETQIPCNGTANVNDVLNSGTDPERAIETACKASALLESYATKAVGRLYNDDAHPEPPAVPDQFPTKCHRVKDNVVVMHLNEIQSSFTAIDDRTSKVLWKANSNVKKHKRALRYNETIGHVVVLKTGFYFIMSQLLTRLVPVNSANSIDIEHRVNVIKESENRRETIMLEHLHTTCELVSNITDQMTSLGAVFSLKKGDQFHVTTSHPKALAKETGYNYLTIFLL